MLAAAASGGKSQIPKTKSQVKQENPKEQKDDRRSGFLVFPLLGFPWHLGFPHWAFTMNEAESMAPHCVRRRDQ